MKLAISVVVIMPMLSQLLAAQQSLSVCSESAFEFTVDNKLLEVHIDGVQVQYTPENKNEWGLTYRIQVPGSARVIAIKGWDNELVVAGILGSGASSATDASWKCTIVPYTGWTGVRFDDSAWPAATEIGSNGIPPWGVVSGIGRSAKWIWTEKHGQFVDGTVYCRKKRDCIQPTGVDCIVSCSGHADGKYQSCKGCGIYATCTNGILQDDVPCVPGGQVWDDRLKRCAWTQSTTCVQVT